MLLFSYGSNSPQQLAVRLGHPVQGEAAYLPRHRRVFRGHSYNWDGGVASVVPDDGRHVFGFVFEANRDDVEILDRYEGVAGGYYTRNRVTVTMADGSQRAASVYKATATEPSKPSRRYLKTIADTVGTFWAGDITWRSFPTANDGRGPRKRGRSARAPRAVPFTNFRTDRGYCICPATDGLLYVQVPTFDHLLRFLTTRRWTGEAHLRTIDGYVPYFGGTIAFHAERLALKGVKPMWHRRFSDVSHGEADRQLLEDGVYVTLSEARKYQSGYPQECEWVGPRGLRFEDADIAAVYVSEVREPIDLRRGKGRLLKQFVPKGVPVKKGRPPRGFGKGCA